MDSAKLNRIVVFQKRCEDKDEIGNIINHWCDYYRCHATVSNFSSNESEYGAQTLERTECDFTIRSCEKVKCLNGIDFRLLYNGDIWNVSPPEDNSYHKQYVKIHAEKAHNGKKD